MTRAGQLLAETDPVDIDDRLKAQDASAACARGNRAPVILADEPTAPLDGAAGR